MSQSALAFGIQRPSTLDDALNVIDRLSGAVASRLAEGIDQKRHMTPDIERLVRVRRALKAGRIDDALYDLERVLSELDSGWMCRA